MPQPNKIPLAFAASGDKNVIPESTETTGLASWREGFPAITSAPFSEGGIAPKRADFNGIFNALSQAVMWLQQGGVYAYDSNTDYEAGNVVLDAGGLYVANAGNGPSSTVVQPSSDTTGATWKLVRLDLATQSAAGYMSAADKAKLDTLAWEQILNPLVYAGQYYKLQCNNIIVLVGRANTTANSSSTLVFPEAFPNGCLAVLATPMYWDKDIVTMQTGNFQKTGCDMQCVIHSFSGNQDFFSREYSWIALGM